MNWTDCTSVWQRQTAPALTATPAELAALRNDFEATRRREARTLFIRDCLEGGTGFVVAAVFALFWWLLRLPNWPMALSVALVLGVSAAFVRERLRARRARVGAYAPLLAKVEADLAEMLHQRRLLLSLHTWYLGPLWAAVILVLVAVALRLGLWQSLRSLGFSVGFALLYLAVLAGVWLLNRYAVRHQLDPHIAELEKLRAALKPVDAERVDANTASPAP